MFGIDQTGQALSFLAGAGRTFWADDEFRSRTCWYIRGSLLPLYDAAASLTVSVGILLEQDVSGTSGSAAMREDAKRDLRGDLKTEPKLSWSANSKLSKMFRLSIDRIDCGLFVRSLSNHAAVQLLGYENRLIAEGKLGEFSDEDTVTLIPLVTETVAAAAAFFAEY